jgi:hypothetical protein
VVGFGISGVKKFGLCNQRFGRSIGRLVSYLFTSTEPSFLQIDGSAYRRRYSDLLQAGRSVVQIPMRAKFSELVHVCPGAHPASSTRGTGRVGVASITHPHTAPSLKKK